MRRIPAELCVRCKGAKFLCGLTSCPILERFRAVTNAASKVRLDVGLLQGSTPPSVIVGEKGYPKVSLSFNVAPEVVGEQARLYEDPAGWWGRASLHDIINYRSSLVSNFSIYRINDVWKLYEREISLATISERPVLSESKVTGKLETKLKFDGIVMPRGPTVKADDIRVTENPKVPKILDRLINDDVKANDAVLTLYRGGEDVYRVVSALSTGLLGTLKNRKLVPTRWAITAVDSIVGDSLLKEVRDLPWVSETSVFFQGYLGNYFHIIIYPSSFFSTWVEIWYPTSLWAGELTITDLSEDYWGKYGTLDGGYMAARLAALEYLTKIRRSAGVMIIREVTGEYFAPVGNWHIRETVRRAFNNRLGTFQGLGEALDLVQGRLKDGRVKLREIRAIKRVLNQTRIDSFFDS